MGNKCPICNGEGKRIVVVKSTITKRMKTITEWCVCVKSRYISQIYEMLEPLKETYLPLNKIDKRLIFKPDELSKSPNIYIINTDIDTFYLHIKSILIKYKFIDNPPSIYLCKSINILKRFYVKQEDGSTPSLSDLNKFDLVIFTLDTKEKNDQLKTCVAQVVYNRLCIFKPTWIYLPELTMLENTIEYSEELKSYLNPLTGAKKAFTSISLTGTGIKVKTTQTINQSRAEGFSR